MEIFYDYKGKQGLCASLCVRIHIRHRKAKRSSSLVQPQDRTRRTPGQCGEPTQIAGFLSASRDETRGKHLTGTSPRANSTELHPEPLASRHSHPLEGTAANRGAGFRERRRLSRYRARTRPGRFGSVRPGRGGPTSRPAPHASGEEAQATLGRRCRGRRRPPSPRAGGRSPRRGLRGGRGELRVPPLPPGCREHLQVTPRRLAAAPRAARRGGGGTGATGAISQPPPPGGSPLPQPPRQGGAARHHPAPAAA